MVLSIICLYVLSEASCLIHRIVIISITCLDKTSFHTFSYISPSLSCCIPYSLLKSAWKGWGQKGDSWYRKQYVDDDVMFRDSLANFLFFFVTKNGITSGGGATRGAPRRFTHGNHRWSTAVLIFTTTAFTGQTWKRKIRGLPCVICVWFRFATH